MNLFLNRRLRDFEPKTAQISEGNSPSPLQLFEKSKGKETERKANEAEATRIAHNQKMEDVAYFLGIY